MENEGLKTVSVAHGQRKVTPQWSKHFKRDCCTPPPPEKPASPLLLHGELAEIDVLTERCLTNYSLEILLTKSKLAMVTVYSLPICLLLQAEQKLRFSLILFCRSHNRSYVCTHRTPPAALPPSFRQLSLEISTWHSSRLG